MKDNKLIAEFMEFHRDTEDLYLIDNYNLRSENQFQATYVREMKFHSSWDWLMPVVEKIECTKTDDEDNSDSFFNVMIEVFECNINGRDICICENGNTKLEATYKAVVKFINQYNKI